MATTTTFWAIRDNYIVLIEARAPNELTNHRYRRGPRHIDLRRFADEAGSAALRMFDIHRSGEAIDPESFDPSAFPRTEEAVLTMAYPLTLALYGREDLNDVECVIESDAKLLGEILFASSNYLAGQSLGHPTVRPIDKSSPDVWFQEIALQLIYTEAQTLT